VSAVAGVIQHTNPTAPHKMRFILLSHLSDHQELA
jgi:hypothetical protein